MGKIILNGVVYTVDININDEQPTFTEAQTRANIQSGESVSTLFGKIKKWFTDLKSVAFSGSYTDLSNKPSIPTKTSDLTNDSDFVSDASYVHTDENFTSAEKTKLGGIASGAEANVQSDWNEADSTSDAYIANKPTIPAAQIQSDWNQSDSSAVDYIKNKPTIPSGGDTVNWTQIMTTGTKIAEIDINGTPTDVYAPTSGGSTYTEGDGIDINSSNVISVDTTFTEAGTRVNIASGDAFATILGKIKKFFTDLKTVAFTGAYSDLSGTPTLGAAASKGVALNLTTQVTGQYVLDAYEGYVLDYYRKTFIVGKKVYVSASVTAGNDYPITCTVPSGYIPLCVTCSEYMHGQGIMGSPTYVTSGTTKCRWRNLTSGTVTLNAQLCVFYFVKNEITVS